MHAAPAIRTQGFSALALRALLLTPWLWLALFGATVAATSLMLGRLPAYGDPDPKQMALLTPLLFSCLYALLIAGLSPLAIAAWTSVSALSKAPLNLPRSFIFTYLAGLALMAAIIFLDPLGLMTWLLD